MLYAADPAAKCRATAAYRREHPEYGLVRARLAKGGGVWVGDITPEGLEETLARYKNRCYICDDEFTEDNRVTWDHFHPIARGGDHGLDNLRPACAFCNKKKQSRWPFTEEDRKAIHEAKRALSR